MTQQSCGVVPYFKMETMRSVHSGGWVDSLGRYERRISACPHASLFVEVPALQGEQQDVSVHLTAYPINI